MSKLFTIGFIQPVFITLALITGKEALAAGEIAALKLTSNLERCVISSENEQDTCEQLTIPEEEVKIELKIIAEAEGGRIWAGSFRESREVSGIVVNRAVIVLRAYAADDSAESPVMNSVFASQSLGSSPEGDPAPSIMVAAKNLDDLQYASLINPPVVNSEARIGSSLVIYGKNAFAAKGIMPNKLLPNLHEPKEILNGFFPDD